jgi:predicted DNA-binding ribbon-helix-helix protein
MVKEGLKHWEKKKMNLEGYFISIPLNRAFFTSLPSISRPSFLQEILLLRFTNLLPSNEHM